MPTHTAKSLFHENIQSSVSMLELHKGIAGLKSGLDTSWLLRAVVVFSVAALDAYFHDKVKYRVGHFCLNSLPNALARFEVPLEQLKKWDKAWRKGNVIRGWVVDDLSRKSLQGKDDIADALRLVGIEDFWGKIEPDTYARARLLGKLRAYVQRRNWIVHEGDRQTSRRSGKKLRGIERPYAKRCLRLVGDIVASVERKFPG